jgi:hypothetical protein
MLCEDASMRATERVKDVSFNTVKKLLVDAGRACAMFHDATVHNVKATKIQCDELWEFCYAKAKNVPYLKTPVEGAGDIWTWTAIEATSKLLVSWMIGNRDGDTAAGAGFSPGRAGIATKIRYAFGIPCQGFQRRPMLDAMPTRQHTRR